MDQSLKAYYREFRRVVEASDVVLEVLDARDPLGCRCPQVEEAVLVSGTNKKLILVLNKIGKLGFASLPLPFFSLHITSYLSLLSNLYPFSDVSILSPLADLVPKEIVELWLKHLRNEFPAVAFKASTQTQKHNLVSNSLLFFFSSLNPLSLLLPLRSSSHSLSHSHRRNFPWGQPPTQALQLAWGQKCY